jgi:hypothetical protein
VVLTQISRLSEQNSNQLDIYPRLGTEQAVVATIPVIPSNVARALCHRLKQEKYGRWYHAETNEETQLVHSVNSEFLKDYRLVKTSMFVAGVLVQWGYAVRTHPVETIIAEEIPEEHE